MIYVLNNGPDDAAVKYSFRLLKKRIKIPMKCKASFFTILFGQAKRMKRKNILFLFILSWHRAEWKIQWFVF